MWSIPPIPFPTASPWATSGRRRGRAGAWGAGGAGRGAGVRGGRPAQGPGAPRPKPEAEVCVVRGRTRCPVLRFAASPEPLYANSTWRSPRQTSDALARLRTDRWTIRHAQSWLTLPRGGVGSRDSAALPCPPTGRVEMAGMPALPTVRPPHRRRSVWPLRISSSVRLADHLTSARLCAGRRCAFDLVGMRGFDRV